MGWLSKEPDATWLAVGYRLSVGLGLCSIGVPASGSFDMPPPLQFGRVVMVREKDWQLLNAFDPRMKQGVYLGPEDIDSVSGGHLVLLPDGVIARATTIHPSDAPVRGLTEAAAKLGWSSDKTPDGRFFWRHEKGERCWTDPTLQVWTFSRDPANCQFWTHMETQENLGGAVHI